MKPLAVLLAGHKKNAANGFHRAAFTTDHATHIMRGNADLDTDILSIRDLTHLDRVGLADERFNDFLYSFFHRFVEFVGSIEFIENKRLNKLKELNKLLSNYVRRVVFDQALDRLGRLSSNADPVLNTFMIQCDLGRIDHRVICTYVFEVLAVALAALFLYHEAIKGFTLRAHSH